MAESSSAAVIVFEGVAGLGFSFRVAVLCGVLMRLPHFHL